MSRKLDALRALAERPGTEAEGEVARAMLEKLEASEPESDPWELFRQYLRTGDMELLWEATRDHEICACGSARKRGEPFCHTMTRHWDILREMKHKFPIGARVYYNRWAYGDNCPAVVIGYTDDSRCRNQGWNWIRLKFDHLKSNRSVPIYEYGNWHLSTEPIEEGENADRLRGLT